jgi:signal transduction histidine kinase
VRGISSRPDNRSRRGQAKLDLAWLALLLANLAAVALWPNRDTIPFHVISICFALLFWLRVWPASPVPWGIGIVLITTVTSTVLNLLHDAGWAEEVVDAPLLALMFVAVVWHANRRITADAERHLIADKNARLLAAQRQFLQDASHHLRTPVTIALTYAELLARQLTGEQELRDIQMVVGEMARLRLLSERLLVIAASEDPDFLRAGPVALDEFAMEAIERWRPTASRRWRIGRLDAATVLADPERLGLAVDALLENAVKFTRADDVIELSVASDGGRQVRLGVSDSGGGVSAIELPQVFDRFRTGGDHATRGTGLGLALVRAVADAHGGSVSVRSVPGEGSDFEILLPLAADAREIDAAPVSLRASPPGGRSPRPCRSPGTPR